MKLSLADAGNLEILYGARKGEKGTGVLIS